MPEWTRKRLGKAIRARRGAPLTLEDLAAAAEISDRYLGEVERGSRNASVDVAAKIAAGLGTTLQKLLDGASNTSA